MPIFLACSLRTTQETPIRAHAPSCQAMTMIPRTKEINVIYREHYMDAFKHASEPSPSVIALGSPVMG